MARTPEKVLIDMLSTLNLQLANIVAQNEKLTDENTALNGALKASQDDVKRLASRVTELEQPSPAARKEN